MSAREAPDGQRVMDHHYAGCGTCPHCRLGWSQLCRAGITVYGVTAHGGHADYLKVPARTLVQLPEELSFAEGAYAVRGAGIELIAEARDSTASLPGPQAPAPFAPPSWRRAHSPATT